MTKQQMWDLIEIYTLLQDTDQKKNIQGFDALTLFIEENLFKTEGDA